MFPQHMYQPSDCVEIFQIASSCSYK